MTTIEEAIAYATNALGIQYKLKSFQKDVINSYANGQDCFCVAPTGAGKSLTFTMAPFVMDWLKGYRNQEYTNSVIVIIQPLVALMKEQARRLNKSGIQTVYMGSENVNYDDVCSGKFNVNIASPETATSDRFLKLLKSLKEQLAVIFVDEGHCIHAM